MGGPWTPDSDALALLDMSGAPFDVPEYRQAWTESMAGWHDTSFGAHAPDGTQAAISLLARQRGAESLPLGYGGIVSSRALNRDEASSFLAAARREAHADDLRAIAVPIDPPIEQLHLGGCVVGWSSVVYLDRTFRAETRFTKKAAQAISRAERAGGVAGPGSDDPEPFIGLYGEASQQWSTQYPANVLRHLARSGRLRLFNVELDESVEASAVALVGKHHWMYWLAAQSERARKAELGYLALTSLIAEAHKAGTGAVNLGASAGLSGVAAFKRRFGAVDIPVLEYRSRRRGPAAARVAIIRARGRWAAHRPE